MTEYMLDTNICIAVMKGRMAVRSKISGIDPAGIGISSIVLAEHFSTAYGKACR